MSQSDSENATVGLCCCTLKKTPRAEKAVQVAKRTMEDIFQATFETLRREAGESGMEIPIEFKGKMLKWGAKMNLFLPEGK